MATKTQSDEIKAQRKAERLKKRQALIDAFSPNGNYRADTFAAVIGCGESSLWAMVADGRISKPLKLSARTSVWSGEYINSVKKHGVTAKAVK